MKRSYKKLIVSKNGTADIALYKKYLEKFYIWVYNKNAGPV